MASPTHSLTVRASPETQASSHPCMRHIRLPVVLLIGAFDPNQTVPVPYAPQRFPACSCQVLARMDSGEGMEPPRSPQAACSEQQLPQEGEQTASSPFFAIFHLLPARVPIRAALSPGPIPHVIHFSRAFPGFGTPEALQAGMNILTIPCWPQTPTLGATRDFLFFYLLLALHKPSGSVCHLLPQDKN